MQGHVGFDNANLEKTRGQKDMADDTYSENPADLTTKTFNDERDVCVKEIKIELKTVIESYKKCISMFIYEKLKKIIN